MTENITHFETNGTSAGEVGMAGGVEAGSGAEAVESSAGTDAGSGMTTGAAGVAEVVAAGGVAGTAGAGEVGAGVAGKKAAGSSGLSPEMTARPKINKGLSVAELNGLTGRQANSQTPFTDQELAKMTDTTAIIISEFRISPDQVNLLRARGFTFEPLEGRDCNGWRLFYVRGSKAPEGKIQFQIGESEPAPSLAARIGWLLKKVFGRAK